MKKDLPYGLKLRKFQKIKRKQKIECQDYYKMVDGFVEIPICIHSHHDIYNKFCAREDYTLNRWLYAYIDKRTLSIPPKYPIKLIFEGEINEEDKPIIRSLKEKHYDLEFNDKSKTLHNINFLSGALFIFGVLLLCLSYVLTMFYNQPILSEVANIATTFSIWKCCEIMIVDREKAKANLLNTTQLILSKVEFRNTYPYTDSRGVEIEDSEDIE